MNKRTDAQIVTAVTFNQRSFHRNCYMCRGWGILLGDEQADFSHVHQFGPTLHCGCADVWDHTGQRRVLFGGQDYQHADGVAVIGQLDHLIFQPLRCGGHACQRLERLWVVSKFRVTIKAET